MTAEDEKKVKQLMLRAKGYPVRISTHQGKFFTHIGGIMEVHTDLPHAIKGAIATVEYMSKSRYQ
jgi:hypothetical protein